MSELDQGSHRQIRVRVAAIGLTGIWVAGLISACGTANGTPTPEAVTTPISINELFGDPDDRRLALGVNSCQDDPKVDAVETDDEVRLTVTIVGERSGLECQDSVDVVLNEPLGNRQVRDMATQEIVVIEAPEEGRPSKSPMG
jgi:hypothetical protein